MALWIASVPILVLVSLIFTSVLIFGSSVTEGPAQISLCVSASVAAVLSHWKGHSWEELEKGVVRALSDVSQAIFILLLIGSLISIWIAAGIVPLLVTWGLEMIQPEIFYPTVCLLCSLGSLLMGSSWSTAGTLGIAMVGTGSIMGMNPAITAGAVISGSYFGDKLSPFSETTNLAASITGTGLFPHIRHMLYTTLPSMGISLVLYTILSVSHSQTSDQLQQIDLYIRVLHGSFHLNPLLSIPPIVIVFMILKKVPAIPAILIGILLGIVSIFVFQMDQIVDHETIRSDGMLSSSFHWIWKIASDGYRSNFGLPALDSLMSKGGMASMTDTVWLILAAMFFAGIMQSGGFLDTISQRLRALAKTQGSLIVTTVLSSVVANAVVGEQYLSIIVTGKLMEKPFQEMGLESKNLSRALEDGGTLTSALFPWNTCGAFMAGVLGVSTIAYLPFAFLNWINPIVGMLYGLTGWTIHMKEGEITESKKSLEAN